MRGTWQTDDHARGAGLAVAVIGTLLVISSGAAAAAVSAVAIVLIAAAVVIVLGVLGLGGLIAWRIRHPDAGLRVLPPPVQRLSAPDRPALEPPAPREVHQHWHLHIAPGTDPEAAAEVLRQHQRPE